MWKYVFFLVGVCLGCAPNLTPVPSPQPDNSNQVTKAYREWHTQYDRDMAALARSIADEIESGKITDDGRSAWHAKSPEAFRAANTELLKKLPDVSKSDKATKAAYWRSVARGFE